MLAFKGSHATVPTSSLDLWAWARAHLLALIRLGDAALGDDFDRVGVASLHVSGLVAAGEAPLWGRASGRVPLGRPGLARRCPRTEDKRRAQH